SRGKPAPTALFKKNLMIPPYSVGHGYPSLCHDDNWTSLCRPAHDSGSPLQPPTVGMNSFGQTGGTGFQVYGQTHNQRANAKFK
ncbi:MAG TPA: hypothetical protein VG536_15650, partial [Pseudomonas sp.]|nr:hypothetical protein [Pseudomonas sp.]